MSKTGDFILKLQNNDEHNLFTAYQYLSSRLSNIINPTVNDIEKTHLLYIKTKYYPYVSLSSEYVKVVGSSRKLGRSETQMSFTLPNTGHFTNDIVLHVRVMPVGNKSAYLENREPTSNVPLYRYCAYPGIKMLTSVEFTSGSISIDRYTPEDVIAYKNFFVSKDHKPGWDRCHGHDEVQNATYNSRSFTGVLNYSNGYQTPKLYHEAFDMFIPLHFWFCEDVGSALINYPEINNSQRKINITFDSFDNIIQSLIYDNTGTNSTSTTPSGTTLVPLPIDSLMIQTNLYVNQLYTQPDILNIIKKDSFNMIRVHKQQISGITASNDQIGITNLNYPGEFLCVGFRNTANLNDFDKWHLMGSSYITPDTNQIRSMHVPAIIWNADHGIRQLVTREAVQCTSLNNILEDVEITVNDIPLYPKLSSSFFNDYLPIRYSKNSAVVSPFDNNMILITFCLYPGKSNPSGFLDMSTCSKDFKIKYWLHSDFSDVVNNRYQVIICMSALNFLFKSNEGSGDQISLLRTL
jgi:hypothetical protein